MFYQKCVLSKARFTKRAFEQYAIGGLSKGHFYSYDSVYLIILVQHNNVSAKFRRMDMDCYLQLFSEKCTIRYFKVRDDDLSSKQG